MVNYTLTSTKLIRKKTEEDITKEWCFITNYECKEKQST